MIDVIHGDCVSVLSRQPADTIPLVVTSPPYNVGIAYEGYEDSCPLADYLGWCEEWLAAVLRVMRPDGRLCLNVPLDTSINRSPLGMEILARALKVGYRYHAGIVWNKRVANTCTAFGSFASASAPNIVMPVEMIWVLYKEQWKREEKGESDITPEEFKQWWSSVWTINGSHGTTGHPAPFPDELVMRCIKLFSYVGDTVLDPFAGSGTTLFVARNHGRHARGIELSDTYYQIIQNRLSQLMLW